LPEKTFSLFKVLSTSELMDCCKISIASCAAAANRFSPAACQFSHDLSESMCKKNTSKASTRIRDDWNIGAASPFVSSSWLLPLQLWPPSRKKWGDFSWVFFHMVYMDVSENSGTPKWMVYNGKPYQNG